MRSDQECHSLPGDHLQHHDSARDLPHDLELATDALYRSAAPSRSTPRRRELKTDPRHPLHAMLAFLAAHVASSPSRTPWLFSSVHRHRPTPAPAVLPGTTFTTSCVRSARNGRSPSPAPLLSRPRAPSASPPNSILPDPHTPDASPLSAQHLRQPLPIARAVVITSPPAATMSNASLSSAQTQPLSGTGSTTRSIAGARSKCNERARCPCRLHRLPAPGAGFLCAHASLCYKPRPAAQREHDGHHPPRCAAHAAAIPPSPHTHVHPQCHTAPLVGDYAAPPPMRSTPRASYPSPAPAASAAMTLLRAGSARTTRGDVHPALPPVPAFHPGSQTRADGAPRHVSVRRTRAGNGTYAAPGFRIAPRPVQFESPARAASTGRGTA